MDKCPKCGVAYKRLATHWVMSNECSHPEPTDTQKAILRILAAKYTLKGTSPKSRYPSIQISTRNREYLDAVKEELGWMAGNIVTNSNREREEFGKPERPPHVLFVRSHPYIKELKGGEHD